MFSRSQIAKNLTLASLNSRFYSPPSTTKPRLGSPNVQDPNHGFQSNSFQMSPGPTPGFSPASTGLGIMFPVTERTRCQEGLHGAHRFDSDHDVMYRHRLPTRTKAIFEPDGVLEGTTLEAFSWPSLLDHADYPTEYLDLISNEPVIERKQDSLVHVTLSAPPVSHSVEKHEEYVLQRVLGAPGHTLESLSTGLALLGDNGHTETGPKDQILDLQSNAADIQTAFRCLRDSPTLGINPAQIMLPQSDFKHIFPQDPQEILDLNLGYPEGEGLEPETKSSVASPASSPDILQMSLRPPVPLTAQNLSSLSESAKRSYRKNRRMSDYEPSLSSSSKSSDESMFVPSLSGRRSRSGFTRAAKRPIVKRRLTSPDVPSMPPPTGELNKYGLSDLSINYGTPVLDAHRGITLSELRAKAERYRLRNHCQAYDKKWLLSFAGKLTPQGLLAENYRCYIVGCNQSNRRRDHIVIHVGGHLDQRPWVCKHCPARFLRKNECKRHELSHTGTRPFVCDICPSGTSAFARQDLLKRHEKRTHNLDTTRGRTTKRHRHT